MSKKTKPSPVFTRDKYFRALALDNLSSYCHQQMLLMDDCGSDDASQAFSDLSSEFHKQAHALFPLRPHEGFDEWQAGERWKKSEGLKP